MFWPYLLIVFCMEIVLGTENSQDERKILAVKAYSLDVQVCDFILVGFVG